MKNSLRIKLTFAGDLSQKDISLIKANLLYDIKREFDRAKDISIVIKRHSQQFNDYHSNQKEEQS